MMYFTDATLTLKLFIETKSTADWSCITEKMIMNKIANATEQKDILKQLALEFISDDGKAKFEQEETVTFSGIVSVYGDVKTDRSDDYYISTTAEFPKKCKFLNEITVSATCCAVEDGEDVFDCKLEDIGLTKKQLAAFIRQVKSYSIDYK